MEKEKTIPGGLFITFEGADGCGKTTQIAKLQTYLASQGYTVIKTREPGGTELAEKIRALLLTPDIDISSKTELMLYLAARAEHMEKVILPALKNGSIVLCDRFSDSTMVNQGIASSINIADIETINNFVTNKTEPDMTILLDAPVTTLAARRKERGVKDRIELEGIQLQKKVRDGFLQLMKKFPERIHAVDALPDVETVQKNIRHLIDTRIKAISLWETLANVPINEKEEIETEWHGFPAGTSKFDIWQWFERTFNLSIQTSLIWRA